MNFCVNDSFTRCHWLKHHTASGSESNKPADQPSSSPQDSVSTQPGPFLYPLNCLFRWFPKCSGVSVCLYKCTYLWFCMCVCLYVCLCACQAEHSCVKLTVWDSWGPQAKQRWRGEIRYFLSLCLRTYMHTSFSCPTCSWTTETDTHRHYSILFTALLSPGAQGRCTNLCVTFLLNISFGNSHQFWIKCA